MCVYFKKNKKKGYYENVTEKSVVDYKHFWKAVKPLLSDKVAGKDEIHLIANNDLVRTDIENAQVLINFFFNIEHNLDISRYSNDEPIVCNTNDSTYDALLQFKR